MKGSGQMSKLLELMYFLQIIKGVALYNFDIPPVVEIFIVEVANFVYFKFLSVNIILYKIDPTLSVEGIIGIKTEMVSNNLKSFGYESSSILVNMS